MKISWEKIQKDIMKLSNELKDESFNGLVAITRGGLVPTAIISQALNLKQIEVIAVESYEDRTRNSTKLLKSFDHSGEGLLVIDDLVDSGETAKLIRKLLPNAKLAVVYAKPEGKHLVDFFSEEVEQNTWLTFPWEEI